MVWPMTPYSRPHLEFAPVVPARAVDEIAAQVRDLIATGKIKPGDRLPSERDLSARLHVSRNTLREALRALENAHIIEMRKGATGGAFVRSGNSDVIVNGLRDLYHLGTITPAQLTEARLWISEIVVRIACERATEEDFAALDANIDASAKATEFDERARHNREFHVILAHATRNPIMVITMESIMSLFARFIVQIGPSDNSFVLPSRRRFMKHLRARDAVAAGAERKKVLGRLQTKYMHQWDARSSS
jgi:GntR family transcriptional repressor for pyruvate dehydrogenase complex